MSIRWPTAITDETLLVSVMLANNEIGVMQPLAEIGALCRERGVLLHCDATQAVGRVPVDVQALQVDLLSFSAHKIYGPKGVGALYVRRERRTVRLSSQIDGGGQERGLRSGTLNVPGIVGLARALELCVAEMDAEQLRLAALRTGSWTGCARQSPTWRSMGPVLTDPQLRLPGNLNCRFPGVDGETLMLNVPDVAVSTGSACTSSNPEPSHVLRALGLDVDQVRSSLRFGLGRFNTTEEIDFAAEAIGAGCPSPASVQESCVKRPVTCLMPFVLRKISKKSRGHTFRVAGYRLFYTWLFAKKITRTSIGWGNSRRVWEWRSI